MAKRTVRLTESELKQMISESVKKVLKETNENPFSDKRQPRKQRPRLEKSPCDFIGFEDPKEEGPWVEIKQISKLLSDIKNGIKTGKEPFDMRDIFRKLYDAAYKKQQEGEDSNTPNEEYIQYLKDELQLQQETYNLQCFMSLFIDTIIMGHPEKLQKLYRMTEGIIWRARRG
jgi:hypothetical protein